MDNGSSSCFRRIYESSYNFIKNSNKIQIKIYKFYKNFNILNTL